MQSQKEAGTNDSVPKGSLEEAQLHCQYASSSLDYKDLPSAYVSFCGAMRILNQSMERHDSVYYLKTNI